MEPAPVAATGPSLRELRPAIVRRFGQLACVQVVIGAVLFGGAGTLRWSRGWLFLALSVGMMTALGFWVLPRNPEVIAARARTASADTKGFDKAILLVYNLLYLALFVVASLEARGGGGLSWHWTGAGAVLMVLATVPVAGAMGVNRNLEPTVRIQSDRGHRVATEGPYRVVRHPMYAALLIQFPATALVLGSARALVPAAACVVVMVVRTALEDRTLQRELPGYAEYAARTRWRLVPGLW